jgi:tetrahydromethanopterin S-methyltransferase subunit B
MTDIGLVKEEIEAKIKNLEAIIEDLNKRVNQDTSLLNDLLAWNEGKLQACKEILVML